MPTEARKNISRDTLTVNSIVSPEETAKLAQDLVRGLKVFSSDQGYRELAELVDRIPKLEKDIEEKDRRLKRANEDLENGEKVHAAELKRNLWLYGDEADRFRKEKAALEKQIKELQTTLSEKGLVISGLEKREEDLKIAGRKLEDAYKGKTSKLKEKESELAKLTIQTEESRTQIGNLSATLKEVQSQVSVLKQSLDQCKQRNTRLNEELGTTHGRATELEKIWNSATSLVTEVFNQDLPEDLLKRPWAALNNAAKFILETPLPQSNSDIAKELRVIKVLGILAELIDKYIFLPTYLLPEVSQFKELLYMVASKEPDKERFLRGMMLSVLQDEQRDAEDQMVMEAMKALMRGHGVEEIVPQVSIAEFEQRLKDILGDAQDAWRAVQYSAHIFACDFEYTQITGFEWQSFEFKAGSEKADTSSPVSTHDPENDLIVLFPRIYLMMPDEEPKPITTGTVVSKTQIRAMVREERENARSAEQTLPRSRNRAGRTLSMSTDGARGGHTREAFLSLAVASERTNG